MANNISISNYNFKNKRALVRVDFNVPMDSNYLIQDKAKIIGALPTINKVLNDGGSVVMMSHLGRPKNENDNKLSFHNIIPQISKIIGKEIKFISSKFDDEVIKFAEKLNPGDIMMLENLRFNMGEEASSKEFAKFLSRLGNVYINDAFGTIHRKHASNYTIKDYFQDKMLGYLIEKEISYANKLKISPNKPVTLIIGGNKISDKIPLINNLIGVTSNILIGSSMLKVFYHAKGMKQFKNLKDEDITLVNDFLKKIDNLGINVIIPKDVYVTNSLAKLESMLIDWADIDDNMLPLDIGPITADMFGNAILGSKTILWNGPVGFFEKKPFDGGTVSIAKSIAEATKLGAFSLVGGGDSASAIKKLGFINNFSYISTGGGAMLYYLSNDKIDTLN